MRTFITLWIVVFQFIMHGQSRWIEPVLENDDVFSHDLFESYDHGYLLLGWYGGSYPSYCWLIKTDINGNLLWQKTFGETTSFLGYNRLDENFDGKIFISGTTTYYDTYRDPIVMKLNACGEKEWCRVFHTPGNYDYSRFILSTDSGGCVVLLNNTGPDSSYYGVRVALAELDADGELLWQQNYNSADSSFQGEIIVHVLKTIDSGYLLTGLCDYEDPSYPGLFWTHPYFIKFDSVGNFEWETIVNKETPSNGGAAWSTVINPDSTHFYSSISHYYHSPSSSAPALLKMDFEGNVIDIYDVVSGYKDGKLSYATFLNDSTLAASAGWGNTDDSLWSRAVIIDTLGNLLNSRVLIQDLYTSMLQMTHDSKLVYLSNTYQNNQFDCYLTKLNQDLEQDTIYTMPFTYDSLCPYQIVSDTIVQDDCGLIVGIEEEQEKGRRIEEESSIKVWPNPARDWIALTFPDIVAPGEVELVVYNVFGQEALRKEVAPTNRIASLNISSLSSGMYSLRSKDMKNRIFTGKFVVAR